MKTLRVWNATRNDCVADRVRLADTWWTRLRGMLGSPEPAPGEGMLLEPCQSVHMYWMKYALDVAFLAPDGRVVEAYHGLGPSKRSRWHREADRALELRAGTLAETGTQVGDRLEMISTADATERQTHA
ncbi:MAG: DUF192 domain-containing protein [Gemmatimonadota bacterium]|nr:DUF192 domain-containing protein [Gemmatimonadota bacterium]MDH3427544.1 DUF192 domain-containing protein [Gemmatimonadota bacterium]